MSDFTTFCQNATDGQLANILKKENDSSRSNDYNTAVEEARRRTWSEAEIKDARTFGAL